jgi:hypothetical protein
MEEIGRKSPLHPALVAPNSKLQIQASSQHIEFCARKVGNELFLLACRREGPTSQIEFRGFPLSAGDGEVMFEAPHRVKAKDGKFTDWFAPFEVHVYRFKL